MTTLKQLQRENARLRMAQTKINELQRLQVERANLIRENKQLAFRMKHGTAVAVTQKFVNTTAKAGVKTWGMLQRYGQKIAAAQRMEKSRNRKLNISAKRKRR